MDKKIKIIIATTKKYRMPDDPMYMPLFVGAARNNEKAAVSGFGRDDGGENISEKNPYYCELTGLYWAWKNLDCEYLGLVHYRRHFTMHKPMGRDADTRFLHVLRRSELVPYLARIRVFVPKKRRYWIETLYTHYAHTHYAAQLDLTQQIIHEKYPEYDESCRDVLKRTWGYMFNMMIMDREALNEYCTWLFDILFELEDRLSKIPDGQQPALSPYQARFYGRVSEIALNIWLDRQLKSGKLKKEQLLELPFMMTEPEKFGKKISAFLKAKFLHKRYTGSF